MTKKTSFENVEKVIVKLFESDNTLEAYQREANIEFVKFMLAYVKNGGEWGWPDAKTFFSLKDGQCHVNGPLARLL